MGDLIMIPDWRKRKAEKEAERLAREIFRDSPEVMKSIDRVTDDDE